MPCRGIRGATTASANTKEAILDATKELLQRIIKANEVEIEDIACVIFTATPDLNAEFPALAAREMGWSQVALLCCGHEMDVPDSLQQCLRILMLANTNKRADEIIHIYLKEAQGLRAENEQPLV